MYESTLSEGMTQNTAPNSGAPQPLPEPEANESTVHVALQRIGANRWCVVDPRVPSNDARCLVGYVERVDHVYHAIRLDSSMTAFDETDLQSVLCDLEPPVLD